MVSTFRRFIFAVATLAAGLLVPVGFAPAYAQDIVPEANRGVPQDWSHRHVIIRDVDTMKESSGKGVVAFERWKERLKDPRFTMAVAKRTFDQQPTANKMFSGQQLAFFDRFDRKPKNASLKRDWNVALGSATAVDGSGTGTGVGSHGMFPAKYTWDINATPSCTNDFIVYSTQTPGATSGTSATATVAFGGTGGFTNADGATLTITNTITAAKIVLVAKNTASATANTGLNWYLGNTDGVNRRQAIWADNLAAAINRNGVTVGVSATSNEEGVVTIVATTAGPDGNSIRLQANTLMTGNLAVTLTGGTPVGGQTPLSGGAVAGVQPTLVAYNQLYKTTCTTGTGAVANNSPNIFWSYNTGTGATVETSPALSLDGTQVAFVQRTSVSSGSLTPGQTAHLVLLKWAAGSAGTHAATVAPTEVAPGAYRGCTAPCMTKFALGANNQNSSPYVDYANDRIYVGDAYGRLHRFDNVFNGTPAAAASWPVMVSEGNLLSSPVFDSVSNQVFVGSGVSDVVSSPQTVYTGGRFHRVDAGTRALVSSAQIGALYSVPSLLRANSGGVKDGAIVDSLAGRVYAFVETSVIATCGTATPGTGNVSCKAVYQFQPTFGAGTSGTAQVFGRGEIAGRDQYIGQFDDAYWSSNPASPTGNLYVCGSGADGGTSRQPSLWRIPINANVMQAPVFQASVTSVPGSGELGASCSPISIVRNGANEYLFFGVTDNGVASGTCAAGQACIYMFQIANKIFNATATASNVNDNTPRYFNVTAPSALDTVRTNQDTAINAAQAGTYKGMTITQGTATPAGGTNTYVLMNGATATSITCKIPAGQIQCTDTYNTASLATGNLVSIQVTRTGTGAINTTRQVQLSKATSAAATASVVTGLPAAGGTSGIVVDNISTQAGTSQVYFSTLARPGRAIQASQAGLN